jgi:primosomal protein N' (replication factor Y)
MPVARILFPLPLPEPFDYAVPESMAIVEGSYVVAPLGKVERAGVVVAILADEAASGRTLKPVTSVFPTPPMTRAMRQFLDFAARYTVTPPGYLLAMSLRSRGGLEPSPVETMYRATGAAPGKLTEARKRVLDAAGALGAASLSALAAEADVSTSVVKGLVEAGALSAEEVASDLPFEVPDPQRAGTQLTDEQVRAAQTLKTGVASGKFGVTLIDGVTGSGKTEVYFEAIAETLRRHPAAQVLVLLPEIALTQAILERFEVRFGSPPAPWHSGLGDKARRRTWREVAHGRARIVIGARSALFLPFQTLGLIIVDEEHDASYKQEEGVTYHARDLAVMRGKCEGANVILASATPSLETLVNADAGRYQRLKLTARPGTAKLPDVSLIDMRADPPPQGQWLSPKLVSAMRETLAAKEQMLLFLNRRGFAPLVLCKACGERLKTPGTENWLVEHRYTGRLICHVTGYSIPKPKTCPYCGAADSLIGVGPGVERVAEEVRTLMPQARLEIFSSDTAPTGEAALSIVERMERGEIDVLIGTQIVAKGHNFPGLTLVGVVDADSGMKGGDLRAGERTYQLLSQVSGRAGRAVKPGRALVQTYTPNAPAMQALAVHDRDGFLAIEREARAEQTMPPFGKLAAIILSAPGAESVDEFSRYVLQQAPNGEAIEVYGPAPAPIAVLRGRHRRRFLVKAPRSVDLPAFMAAWMARLKVPPQLRISVDIDPYSFM